MKAKRLLFNCAILLCASTAIQAGTPANTTANTTANTSTDTARADTSTDAAANTQATATETPSTAPQKEQVRFDIWEFQVEGNTVLDDKLVERSVYWFMGKSKTVDDVDAASVALQTLYKDNGYPTVLVDIPQQDVSSGIVRLKVIEGKVDRLRISGSRYFSLAKIRETVPSLAVGEVPHLPTVQEQLQNLNASNKDLKVTPIFRPGRQPGTVSVELRVKDHHPVHASLEFNGRNSFGTTRTRLIANVSYANLWLKNHDASLTYQTSPQDTEEVRVLVGSYLMPIGIDHSDRLAIYAVRSDSETGVASGGALSVVGKGNILGARYVKPLKGESRYIHSIVFGFDFKDFDESVGLDDGSSLVTPIDYSMFSIDYNATSISDSNLLTFSGGVKFAPRAVGNDPEEFENKRFQANPNFSILNLRFSNEYRFDNGMKLIGVLAGQYSGQPLISNEQFSAGGAESVRGYYESQVLADDAVRASIEYQTMNFDYFLKKGFAAAHLRVFYDVAGTKIYEALPDTDVSQQLSGTGIGMQLSTRENFDLVLDIGAPLKDNGEVESGDVRAHFSIRGSI